MASFMMLQLALISQKLKPLSSLAILWYNRSLDPSSSAMNLKAFCVSYSVENRAIQCLISTVELVIFFYSENTESQHGMFLKCFLWCFEQNQLVCGLQKAPMNVIHPTHV